MGQKRLYVLLVSLVLGTGACQGPEPITQHAPARQPVALWDSLIHVQVTAVDFSLESIAAWDCATFDHPFPEATVTTIIDPVTLARIHRRVTLLQEDPYKLEVDARASAILSYADGHTTTICVGSNSAMKKDSQPVYNDSRLTALLAIDAY